MTFYNNQIFNNYNNLKEKYDILLTNYPTTKQEKYNKYAELKKLSAGISELETAFPQLVYNRNKQIAINKTAVRRFLGDMWEDYKHNQEALNLWEEILLRREIVIALNILSAEQYDDLFKL